MNCKVCGSDRTHEFEAELTLNFPEVSKIDLIPIYITKRVSACLECGAIDLVIPSEKLEALRKEKLGRT